jgi:hypothetical protein
MTAKIEPVTREQWDALTHEEKIEFVVMAFSAADRLVNVKIPDWAPLELVLEAMKLGMARAEAKLDRAGAEYLSVARPGGSA